MAWKAITDSLTEVFPPTGLLSSDRAKVATSAKQWLSAYKPETESSEAGCARFIWAFLGLFPVQGTDLYTLVSSPSEPVQISIANGKILTIEGVGAKPFWNGKERKQYSISHDELLVGGTLEWK